MGYIWAFPSNGMSLKSLNWPASFLVYLRTADDLNTVLIKDRLKNAMPFVKRILTSSMAGNMIT